MRYLALIFLISGCVDHARTTLMQGADGVIYSELFCNRALSPGQCYRYAIEACRHEDRKPIVVSASPNFRGAIPGLDSELERAKTLDSSSLKPGTSKMIYRCADAEAH